MRRALLRVRRSRPRLAHLADDRHGALPSLPGARRESLRELQAVKLDDIGLPDAAFTLDGAPAPRSTPSWARFNDNPLILHYPGSPNVLWVLTPDGGYEPSDHLGLRADLAAYHPDVELADDNGRPVPVRQLVELHGRKVERLVYDLTVQETAYHARNERMGDLVIASAPRDPAVVPVFHPQVDAWLHLLAGDRIEKLLDWLASGWDLSRPTAALYFQGPKSAGKGMFAAGYARMWGRSMTNYNDVAGNYNSALRWCPVVVLDEKARVEADSGFVRSLVAETTRDLTEKHKPTSTLRGAVRLLALANNADAFRIREELEPEDEAAIGERVLYIPLPRLDDGVTAAAAAYLEQAGGRNATEEWVETRDGRPGAIPCHIAWLEQTRKVQLGSRFLVHGDGEEWLRMAAKRGGLQQEILIACARCCGTEWAFERRGRPDGDPPIVYDPLRHEAQVNVEQLQAAWKSLMKTERAPAIGALNRALKVLALPGDDARPRCPRPLRRRRIAAMRVIEAAEHLGVGDLEMLRLSLGLPASGGAVSDGHQLGD